MRQTSSAATAPIASAASRLIEGNSTSQGLAIAVNPTARRLSPRASTINPASGTCIASAAQRLRGPRSVLKTPPDLNHDRLETGIQIETLQTLGCRYVLAEC